MAETQDADSESQSPDETPRLARFEAAVTELETLVEALESGDVTLEQALSRFERGVVLARECQHLLKTAELRVDQLLAEGDDERISAFDEDSEDSAQ